MIVLGAIDHWPARVKWTPTFFKERYGSLDVVVDGKRWKLGELLDRILRSTPEDPPPYLYNQLMADWPPDQVMEKRSLFANSLVFLLSTAFSVAFGEIRLRIIGFSYPNFWEADIHAGSASRS